MSAADTVRYPESPVMRHKQQAPIRSCACVYLTYIYTYTHTYTYIHIPRSIIHTYIHTYIHTSLHTCMPTYTYIHTYIQTLQTTQTHTVHSLSPTHTHRHGQRRQETTPPQKKKKTKNTRHCRDRYKCPRPHKHQNSKVMFGIPQTNMYTIYIYIYIYMQYIYIYIYSAYIYIYICIQRADLGKPNPSRVRSLNPTVLVSYTYY